MQYKTKEYNENAIKINNCLYTAFQLESCISVRWEQRFGICLLYSRFLWERTGHHYHSACAVLVLLRDSDSDSMDLLCDTMIVYLMMT